MPLRDSTDSAVSISYDSEDETYRARFDADAVSPSMAIIETMAAVRETTPTELDPLVETVDPMALDRLVKGNGATDGRILEFRYLDHTVTVRARGIVEIRASLGDGD